MIGQVLIGGVSGSIFAQNAKSYCVTFVNNDILVSAKLYLLSITCIVTS